MWFSSVGAVVGALMYWVLTYQDTGMDLRILGVAFMICGALGFAVSTVFFGVSRRHSSLGPLRSRAPSTNLDEERSVAQADTL